MTLDNITPSLIETVLKGWQKVNFSEAEITALALWLNDSNTLEEKRFLLREKIYQLVSNNLPKEYLHHNEEEKLIKLHDFFEDTPSNESYIALIYCRYLSILKHPVSKLAKTISVSDKTVRRYMLRGFEILNVAIKTDINKNSVSPAFTAASAYFPVMDSVLAFGIDNSIQTILNWLLDTEAFPAVSVEGIGGIGKTLLTQHIWQNLFENQGFESYVWISARQKELTASGEITAIDNFASTLDDITARLAHQLDQTHLAGFSTEDKLKGLEKLTQKTRLLIVLDNLETINDVEATIPAMLKLTGPSKLLITSRKSLSKFPQVRTFPIPELSYEDSRKLILSESERRGLSLSLSDESIRTLYEVTGGVPLALKLAAAQFGFYPVKKIIAQLRAGEKKSQSLFSHIYQQAWRLLDDIGKTLLLAMLTISPEGEDREWICEINNLSEEDFDHGLAQLKRLSLIEFSGSIERPLYRIHRLTTTFLRSNILRQWSE